MEIKCGFQHESYKHAYERTYMSGGAKKYNAALLREKTIAVNTAKNDFAAFQLLLTADTAVSVTIDMNRTSARATYATTFVSRYRACRLR